MKASEMVKRLNALIEKHGDLAVTGGVLSDDSPPKEIIALNENGAEVGPDEKAIDFFISA